MEYEKVIKERFSTRKFKNDKVSDETLKKILEAGNFAPTAKNIQPQKIYVVRSEEGLKKIDSYINDNIGFLKEIFNTMEGDDYENQK